MAIWDRIFKSVPSMSAEETREFMEHNPEGSYTLLDVRQPSEYEESHIPGAVFIPMPDLPGSLDKLDTDRSTIVYCAIGGRSRTATKFLLNQGFKDVYNLTGGIKAWKGTTLAGPSELRLDIIRGDESPSRIAAIAYGMEDALQFFYKQTAENTDDSSMKKLFGRLADMEEGHKRLLKDIVLLLGAKTEFGGEKTLEKTGPPEGILEGGSPAADFMEQNAQYLTTPEDVLSVAMMLETQGLDLYLRFAYKVENEETRDVLLKLADEEKDHLSALGCMMDDKCKSK